MIRVFGLGMKMKTLSVHFHLTFTVLKTMSTIFHGYERYFLSHIKFLIISSFFIFHLINYK
jgi:hypothetical protein